MIDFNEIDAMIDLIELNNLPSGKSFNDFAVKFYQLTKYIPLSKYLKNKDKIKKMPKIMNTKKAGEVIFDTIKNPDVIKFLKGNGYDQIPQFTYQSIMLLRKIDLLDNWTKILKFLEGGQTIEDINRSTRPKLLPEEIEKLETYVKSELLLSEKELEIFLVNFFKASSNKSVLKAIQKLVN